MLRRFHSYGPVDPEMHYCVPRAALVEQCVEQLIGHQEKGGHYFTIWAPRQAGKTWLMRQAITALRARFADRFVVGTLSMQDIEVGKKGSSRAFFEAVPQLFLDWFRIEIPAPARWQDWGRLFKRGSSPFERPLILLIDEFDRLPASLIDKLVGQFRSLYLNREATILHGLALIGVRAVIGVDSPRGSPFNVQRSLHVPNLSLEEVTEMFRQYQEEHMQEVDPSVVNTLHEMTRGQPGLVGWFGELLTEKYNPGPGQPITHKTWTRVYSAACQIEPNNTMLNLLKKAQGPYLAQVLEVFSRTDVPFSFGQDWCNYLYLNGVLDSQETLSASGEPEYVCRFSSPFVQQRLFSDLSGGLLQKVHDLPLDPLDTLADVLTPSGLDVPALLQRYVAYLGRLRQKGTDPWKHQPLRADLHPTEAVGHFHLYNWLCAAVGDQVLVSPEFPTGNGTVDLVLRWQGHIGVIEVKSFVNRSLLQKGQVQAAEYATKLGVDRAAVAVFVPVTDENVLRALSGQRSIGAITVTTVAISWER